MRWTVIDGVTGEGFLLEPKGKAVARVIALPDADQTPEMLAGLTEEHGAFALKLEFHHPELLDGVAMKVARCGGLTESRRIIEYIQQHGLLFFASGLTDPDVALAACVHLFAAYDLPHPAALNAPQFLDETILQTPLRVEGDRAFVPDGAGLGAWVDEERCQCMK